MTQFNCNLNEIYLLDQFFDHFVYYYHLLEVLYRLWCYNLLSGYVDAIVAVLVDLDRSKTFWMTNKMNKIGCTSRMNSRVAKKKKKFSDLRPVYGISVSWI